MASSYLIQVIHKASGEVVRWGPGLKVESDFEDSLIERVKAKGVGVRMTAHVLTDVRNALRELLHDLKAKV